KPSSLTEGELALVKRHAAAGYDLLAPLYGAQGTVARVALEHHERLDGSGYPRHLRGHQTVLAARVVAVADVFDAMTSNRVYKPSQPEYAVLGHLRDSGFSLLDPRLIRVFVQHLVYRTLGRLVRLSNGQVGHVILVDSRNPAKPIVAVGDTLIDLRRTPGLELTGELRHA
ncbi:MAG: HD-GYP domain-containing protein, partial [Methanocella sp.]